MHVRRRAMVSRVLHSNTREAEHSRDGRPSSEAVLNVRQGVGEHGCWHAKARRHYDDPRVHDGDLEHSDDSDTPHHGCRRGEPAPGPWAYPKYTHIHTPIHPLTLTHIHTHAHSHTSTPCTHTLTRAHAHTHTSVHAHPRTHNAKIARARLLGVEGNAATQAHCRKSVVLYPNQDFLRVWCSTEA